MDDRAGLVVVSGIPAAGKSTVAALLARRFARGVHLESDALQRMVVSGAVWPHEEPADEATRQLRQRGRRSALLADSFVDSGFTVVLDDVVIGTRVEELLDDLVTRPVRLVMLVPRLAAVAARDAARTKDEVFEMWHHLDEVVRERTPKVGLWLDTSDLTTVATVNAILRRWDETRV